MAKGEITLEIRPRSFSIGSQTYPLGQIARISVIEARKTWKARLFLVLLVALAGPVVMSVGSAALDDQLVETGEALTVGLGFVAVAGLVGVVSRAIYRDYVLMLETAGAQLGVIESRSREAIMRLRQDIVGYIDDPPSGIVIKQLDNRVFNLVKGDQISMSGGTGNVGKTVRR